MLAVLLIIIFPAVVFGQTEDAGMDMKLYREILYIGLFLLIFVIFAVLINSMSSPEIKDIPREEIIRAEILAGSPTATVVMNNEGFAGFVRYINFIYFSVVALLIIYFVMLLFTFI